MARDANNVRRNALAIPGWLLIVYGVAAMVYAEVFRAKSDFCADGSYVLIDGLCYSVWKLVLPVLLIGVGLAIGGAFGLRGTPTSLQHRLRHGTPSHVGLSILISLVVVPLVFLLIQLYRQSVNDVTYQVELLGVPYKHTFLLELALLFAIILLAAYLAATLSELRRRKDFLHHLETGEVAEAAPVEDETQPFDEAAEWPASRADEAELEAAETTGGRIGYQVPETDVIELEGIGQAYADKLALAGVKTCARLVAEDPQDLATRSGITVGRVARWQKMAELIAVKGIGPQYAEALVRAGINSIDELKQRSAAAISHQVNDYLQGLDNNVLGTGITETRVAGWQEAAKRMRKVLRAVPDA